MTDKYAAFSRLLEEDKLYRDRSLRFEDLCQRIGTDPAALEEVLLRELGMTGEEILSMFRNIDY